MVQQTEENYQAPHKFQVPAPPPELEEDPDPDPELSIEQACEEYKQSVRVTLNRISGKLTESLAKNFEVLDELYEKIAARTRFLENNPTFLACLPEVSENVSHDPLREFDEIRIDLKQDTHKIYDKLRETERMHEKLFDLVTKKRHQNEDEIPEKEVITPAGNLDEEEKPEQRNEEVSIKITTIQEAKNLDNVNSHYYNPVKFQYFPDLKADVWRGRNFEDLHDRLIQQLEATDSLEGFIKHMTRKPSEVEIVTTKQQGKKRLRKKSKNLEEKYTGSLWFFHKNVNNGLSKSSVTSQGSQKKTKTVHSSPGHKSQSRTSSCACSVLVTSSQSPYMTNQEKSRRIHQELQRHSLKCYDLLDDIEKRDLKPISSEYPRRDHLMSHDDLQYFKNLHPHKSYLHKMLGERDMVWRTLLQPVTRVTPKKLKRTHEATKEKYMGEDLNSLISYLTQPKEEVVVRPQNVVCMPVKVVYDNCPFKELIVVKREGTNLRRVSKGFLTEIKTSPKSASTSPPLTPMLTPESSPRPPIVVTIASRSAPPPELTELTRINLTNCTHTSRDSSTSSPTDSSPRSKITEISSKYVNSQAVKSKISSCHHAPIKISKIFEYRPTKTGAASVPVPISRRREMLEHLRGLKARNDTIQKNIQKAIDVIETKMIDILSGPQDSKGTEAFTAMEQEITKVLKMMNDGIENDKGSEKKIEKLDAEKDENCSKKTQPQPLLNPPKLKRGVTMVRRSNNSNNSGDNPGISNFVPGVDLGKNIDDKLMSPRITVAKKTADNNQNKNLEEDKNCTKILRAENENLEQPKRKMLVQERNGKLITMEKKKAANIEEGERLLGQVDNVIKKIDSIYSKFYSDKANLPKIATTTKDKEKQNTYNNVIDFFDGLKQIMEMPPVEIYYKKVENVAQKFQQAKVFDQSSIYYDAIFAKMGEQYDLEKILRNGGGDVPIRDRFEAGEMGVCQEQLMVLQDRHEMILSAFYSVFFSGVFVALNFDFTC